jgi:hypothetical protein
MITISSLSTKDLLVLLCEAKAGDGSTLVAGNEIKLLDLYVRK